MRGYLLAYAIAVAFIIIGERLLLLPLCEGPRTCPLDPCVTGHLLNSTYLVLRMELTRARHTLNTCFTIEARTSPSA